MIFIIAGKWWGRRGLNGINDQIIYRWLALVTDLVRSPPSSPPFPNHSPSHPPPRPFLQVRAKVFLSFVPRLLNYRVNVLDFILTTQSHSLHKSLLLSQIHLNPSEPPVNSSMAPQPIRILPRAGGDSSSTGLYVAGFLVAGLVFIGAVAWLTVRFLRKRAQRNAEDKRGAAFLNVRGLIREDGEKNGEDTLPEYGHQFHFLFINPVLTHVPSFPMVAMYSVSKAICFQGHT